MVKHRGWAFTLNNYTSEQVDMINNIICEYLCYGYEIAPKTGTPHLQGYIKFKNAVRFNSVKQAFKDCNPHLEPVRYEECLIKYNQKDGEFYEKGTRPKSSKQKGETTQDRYRRAIENAKSGDFESIDADLFVRHYNTWERIRSDSNLNLEVLDSLPGIWLCGPSGCGKTSYVHKQYGDDLYIKTATNKWWDGYTGQETVLIDDFDKQCIHMTHYLKIWVDHYPFRAEKKGGSMVIRPKRIIVTSNYTIIDLLKYNCDNELLTAIERRFKQIFMHVGDNIQI